MTKKRFLGNWYLGMGIGALVVAVVAALLLAIINTARNILKNATHALGVANEIVTNTQPIWALDTTNKVVAEIVAGAREIEQHATQIADTLEAPEPAVK